MLCRHSAVSVLVLPAGFSFCGSEGLTEPEGLCGAGYYCALGATSPLPATENDTSVAGVCAPGYACVEVLIRVVFVWNCPLDL